MDFFENVKTLEHKLGETLTEHKLIYQFKTDRYPITLTVAQDQDVGAQMELYSNAEGSVSSADAVLRLIFKLDSLEIQTNSRLVMSDQLMNKIKNLGKKLKDAYAYAYFAAVNASSACRSKDSVEDAAPADFGEFFGGDGDQEEE